MTESGYSTTTGNQRCPRFTSRGLLAWRVWLLLVARGGTKLFLLNLLTRAGIQLPPFPDDFLLMLLIGIYVFSKMTFSADLTDPNCIIMVFSRIFQAIFFCKVRDHCWTEVGGGSWQDSVDLAARTSTVVSVNF